MAFLTFNRKAIFMLKSIFKIWWLLLVKICSGQPSISPEFVCKLPSVINESSGLWVENANSFWSINDSDGDPVLYAFDSTGTLISDIWIENAQNRDWEALASDGDGHLFIGDFGNNNQGRKDLRIYKVKMDLKNDTLSPEVISFHYPDQKSFPAKANFDMEGFFHYKDSLYLFSKDVIQNGTGYSKLYSLPAVAGNYTARLLDSVYTQVPVTGADISPAGNEVLLISYGKIIRLHDFPDGHFMKGKESGWSIPFSQTEAICYGDARYVYYTNEAGRLYRFEHEDIYTAFINALPGNFNAVHISPNPADRFVQVTISPLLISKASLVIVDGQGKEIISMKLNELGTHIPVENLGSGIYYYALKAGNRQWGGKILIE